VQFYLRAGKCLPLTATEVLVELNPPPRNVSGVGTQQPRLRYRFARAALTFR
jgi:hypothetical protein